MHFIRAGSVFAEQVAPWSKTGGLGDVLGSLPIALAERGHRVMVVVPRYECYKEPVDTEVSASDSSSSSSSYHSYCSAAPAPAAERLSRQQHPRISACLGTDSSILADILTAVIGGCK